MKVALFGTRYTSEELRRDPAKRRRALRTGAVAAALALLLSCVSLAYGYVHERPLRGSGLVATQGEVLGMQHRRRSPDRVEVRYSPAQGASRTAKISTTGDFTKGDSVALLYDPSDPGLVRTAEQWRPRWAAARLLGPAVLAGLLVLSLTAGRRSRTAAAT